MKVVPIIIIGVFTLFIGYIGQFIYRSMQKDVELVSEDYYQQEIDFQDKIEMKKRSLEPNKKVSLFYSSKSLSIDFGKQEVESYLLKFYNPTDKRLDKALENSKPKNKELVDLSNFASGSWRCTLYYTMNSQEYIKETTINN